MMLPEDGIGAGLFDEAERLVLLSTGAVRIGGFARASNHLLIATIEHVALNAPFRHMTTRGGHRMSVAMTNRGNLGWVTDRTGYRYDARDPEAGRPWPTMPCVFEELASIAADEAGFPDFRPDACLINRYEPGSRLSLHQDRNERDFDQPIVSASLALPAPFLWGDLAVTSGRYGFTSFTAMSWYGWPSADDLSRHRYVARRQQCGGSSPI